MLTLTTTQKAGLAIVVTPTGGRLDGPPTISSSDPTVLIVNTAADGLSGEVVAVAVGTVTVTATATANGVTLIATETVEVTPAFATAIAIEFGTPTEQ